MGAGYLIDTNVVIDFLSSNLPAAALEFLGKQEPVISVVTRMEVIGWYNATPDQIERLLPFMDISEILPLDETTIVHTIFIRQNHKINSGDMMGQKFEGRGLLGYDNKTQLFTTTWVDNMTTGTMTLKGKWDDATKSITFTGTEVDPMTGSDAQVREVFTINDDNHSTMEMYRSMGGQETKTMEIKFTRAKK